MSITPSRRLLLQAATASLLMSGPALAKSPRLPSVPTSELVEPRMRLMARNAAAPSVALTLDLCPGGFDRRIADVLVQQQIPATLFVTGAWMRRHPEDLAFLLEHPKIFGLQNHGDHHLPPVVDTRRLFGIQCAADVEQVKREVTVGASDLQAVTGTRPLWYRGATGYYSREALSTIEAMGFGIGAYSLNGDQGASLPAEQVARRIGEAKDGDVIISHINQPERSSGQGVAEGVLALKARGMRFVRLDQLKLSDLVFEGL